MSIRVPDFSSARILVVGDVMLDRYWSGNTRRVSPEAPVPVINIQDQSDRLGGAANVAANIRMLGAQVMLLGLLGQDEAGESIERLLELQDINSLCLHDPELESITKLRVLSQNQQMLRLDFEDYLETSLKTEFDNSFTNALEHIDVIVFSDYAKGTLSNISSWIKFAKEHNKIVLVDPKGEDFTKYIGADVLTPNQKEFETIVGAILSDTEFETKARTLREQLSVSNLLITRGENGIYLESATDSLQVSSEAQEVHDVTGAGDTVMAVLAASLAVEMPVFSAIELANIAAGVVVGKVGTSTISTHELRHALHSRGIGGRSLLASDDLELLVRKLQQDNKTIVMTNGCFDILHAGHIAFLEEAKAQGDFLLVAVNDDESVTRLKGEKRPVNKLQDRIAVLAALSAVDWVIPFSEDTPRDLIAKILPDILVKGGDYAIDDIAGGQEVIQAGGDVRVLTYHEGRSTTRIIDQIRKKV